MSPMGRVLMITISKLAYIILNIRRGISYPEKGRFSELVNLRKDVGNDMVCGFETEFELVFLDRSVFLVCEPAWRIFS